MYRIFLNDSDYLGVITQEALSQMTCNNAERFIQAEESAEISLIKYLSENYKIELELNKGKYVAEYDRQITYPVGVHLYYEGKIYEVIRSISGFKAPAGIEYWEEHVDIKIEIESVAHYSQFKTYYPNDIVSYNGVMYKCLAENV
ncbi:hypothetical protein JGH11_18645 [Dysgonomonas sp. Marseille-P4677]|uniref:hypothetical protein n=1 Tax=Dysgonomonas sp. Marseille-P4677 TaxID=2364790 RepID=UPI001911F6B9|nr:hypothetical protein [Dysgonomonas sp. Marseille-P4677]MBK5722892.1 hypothetical protein [Dysgonomonas sp. Marseille-P4677]